MHSHPSENHNELRRTTMASYGLQADVAQPIVAILVTKHSIVRVVDHVLQRWPYHPRKEEVNERRKEINKHG